jgi:hypothetical protein
MQEARGRLTGYLKERAGVRLDSLYMDSLATVNQIEVQKDAPTAMREAADNPDEARKSDKALVKFKDGALTVKEYMRWVRALPPQYGPQIKQANDSTLSQFAKVLSQNVLLLREADKAGIRITPEEWSDLRSRYMASLDTLRREMDLAGPDVTDSSATADERRQVAADKVQQYFDGLVSGKIRLRPLPSALATLLRERMSYRIYPAGINSAVESAQTMRAAKDSTDAGAKVERAPGPAPVPTPGAPTDSGAAAPAPTPAPDTANRR